MRRLPITPLRRAVPAILALALAAGPASAAAATSGPAATGTGTLAPTATAARASAPAAVSLRWGRPHHAYGRVVGLAGAGARVRGIVAHYVPGGHVRVVVRRNGRRVLSHSVAVRRTGGGHGTFLLTFATRRPGLLQVRAAGARHGLGMRVLAASSTSHLAVRLLQNGLAARHYVTSRSGYLDGPTQRALLAYRKVNHLPRIFAPGPGIARTLFAGRGGFVARYQGGRHAEVDISRQVLVLVGAGGHVERIYPASSGKPSTPTVTGSFRVYSKTPGVNSEGMIFASYFTGGYAVHGYNSVPVYAASHGCVRIPPPDAVSVYRWLTYGTPVNVYP